MKLASLPQIFTPFPPPFRHRQNLPPPHSLPNHTPLKLHHPNHPPPKPTTPNPPTTTTTHSDADGIPIEHVKTLAKFKSRHNYIRVLQVSRAADHPLAGSRLLLLDAPGNIHSISYLFKTLTDTYFDVFATLPPILPPGPVAILGFGAGTAAKLILEFYPQTHIHGWELDPSVLAVAREYFNLEKLEKKHPDRLFIQTGDALNASVDGGFAGILIDLFSKGCVVPELQQAATWETLKNRLRRGGRIMVNVGGSCVEPEDIRKDGSAIMEETLKAMKEVFPGEVFVLSVEDRKDDSSVAMAGGLPDRNLWKKAIKSRPLKVYVDKWKPYELQR